MRLNAEIVIVNHCEMAEEPFLRGHWRQTMVLAKNKQISDVSTSKKRENDVVFIKSEVQQTYVLYIVSLGDNLKSRKSHVRLS